LRDRSRSAPPSTQHWSSRCPRIHGSVRVEQRLESENRMLTIPPKEGGTRSRLVPPSTKPDLPWKALRVRWIPFSPSLTAEPRLRKRPGARLSPLGPVRRRLGNPGTSSWRTGALHPGGGHPSYRQEISGG